MTIELNKPAPQFSGINDEQISINLHDFKDKKLVLYFYPKDDTPGCTLEACGFRDFSGKLQALGASIVGVSRDDVKSHQAFKAKHQLTFPLIADVDGKICQDYEVIKEKNIFGNTSLGIERSTFLIDQQGIVRQIWRAVKVPGHIDEVLEAVKKLP